jgi:hypothetical protein
MRAQAQTDSVPVRAPKPLSAEDQAILESLELLEELDLLETWEPADDPAIPAAQKGDVK